VAYLLRLWQESGGSATGDPLREPPLWRASLESLHSHEVHALADPDELFAFLREQMYGARPNSGGAVGEEAHSDSSRQ
jgi:hypothetical protein